MKKINIEDMDRGDKTLEELEAEMSPEALAQVEVMKNATIKQYQRNLKARKRFNRKNRNAWNLMNRSKRLDHMELGMQRILNLVGFKGNIVDAQLPEVDTVEEVIS